MNINIPQGFLTPAKAASTWFPIALAPKVLRLELFVPGAMWLRTEAVPGKAPQVGKSSNSQLSLRAMNSSQFPRRTLIKW
jgi:hypothetical protein